MRLGFGFESPGKDSLTGKSPKHVLGGLSPTGSPSNDFTYSNLPPPSSTEIEFFLESPLKYKPRENVRSGKKTVGCFTFDILVFPAGNQTTYVSSPKMAVYVEASDVTGKDPRWIYSSVKFSVCIVNQKDYRKSLYHDDSHSFCAAAIDRGWPDLLSHSEMTMENGWLDEKGRLCLRASVCVRQADTIQMSSDYETRKETGFIGLKNHGATCYLNGLLQSYFHIGKFREIVYQMKDDEHDAHSRKDPGTESGSESPSAGTRMSLPLALQSVFLKLESSETPVNTIELTRAFGWDSMDAFTQHDVQELARILCDKLEERLKGTSMDRAIQNLFEGQVENYIECMDIDYKSTKQEAFYDIPLNVRGFTGEPLLSLENALREFTAVEVMEGDNAYDAESHGRQRARKGIRFTKFPPVLSFQLKRFSFDYEKLDNVKVNDRFTFPLELDLDPFLTGAGMYDLHTVLVHSGDVHSGHYYAFIRPSNADWFRFDDEQVSRCSAFAAADDNFGGEDVFPVNYYTGSPPKRVVRPRIHSAYMLVYMKRSRVRELLARPSISEVQQRVLEESRKIDERKRMHEEAKQMMDLHVIPSENLTKTSGFSHSIDWASVPGEHVRVKRDTRIVDLAQQLGGNPALFYMYSSSRSVGRWTLMAPLYQSASVTPKSSRLTSPQSARVDFPRTDSVELGDRKISDFPISGDDMHVLVVRSTANEPLNHWTDATPFVLVTVKFFNVANKSLETIGVRHVHVDERVGSLVPWVIEQVGPTTLPDLLVFEEETLRAIEPTGSFSGEHVATGSVLIFQENTISEAETDESSEDEYSMVPQLNVPSFTIRTIADYAHALVAHVTADIHMYGRTLLPAGCDGLLASQDEALVTEPPVSVRLEMDARWNMRVVVNQVMKTVLAGKPLEDNERLELFTHNPYVSKEGPVGTSEDLTRVGKISKLADLLGGGKIKHLSLHVAIVPKDSLVVRLFDNHVVEIGKKFVNVHALPGNGRAVTPSSLAGQEGELRIVEFHKSQITKLHAGPVDCQAALGNVHNVLFEYVRVEPGSVDPGPGNVWLFVSHADKASGLFFGYPFAVAVDVHASAKQVRQAIQEKLGISEKQAGKWRICLDVGGQKLLHLKEDDVVVAIAGAQAGQHVNIVLEHAHPKPELMGIHKTSAHAAAYKPLTIR